MSKPVNFRYSNNLTSTQQPIVKQKGYTNNTGIAMAPSSNANMGGFSRPNVNVGHIAPGQGTKANPELYESNLNFRGPFRKAYPMKHWRRQLAVNGKTKSRTASVSLSERPGGTVFRGYSAPGNMCSCDSNNNLYITFDNKYLQSTSKTIKPQTPQTIPDTINNKVLNNGFIQVGPIDGDNSYQIQTGVYETKNLCSSKERDARKKIRSDSKVSKSYFSSTKQYLKNKCMSFEQKQSINKINGNNYTSELIGDRSTQFSTNNCTNSFQTGRDCHNVTYYNPNNTQFSKQGAVESSTRLLKLNIDTITNNGNSFRTAWGDAAANAGKYHGASFDPTFIKSKYNRTLAWRRNGEKNVCSGTGCNGPSQTLSSFWGGV
jgi:hypothetical protein